MFGIIITTIITSLADSFNPIAIAQQFFLQGIVKKAKHIWYFIISIGLTNFSGGILAYFGLINLINGLLEKVLEKHSKILFLIELILGVAFLIGAFYLFKKSKVEDVKKEIMEKDSSLSSIEEKETVFKRIKSVSPLSLVILGVVATISELTTALPYFAFLGILFTYKLSFLKIVFILLLYNFIYVLPLMVLYFVYVKSKDKFDLFYNFLNLKMAKISLILIPTVFGFIGIFLIFHSLSFLLK